MKTLLKSCLVYLILLVVLIGPNWFLHSLPAGTMDMSAWSDTRCFSFGLWALIGMVVAMFLTFAFVKELKDL